MTNSRIEFEKWYEEFTGHRDCSGVLGYKLLISDIALTAWEACEKAYRQKETNLHMTAYEKGVRDTAEKLNEIHKEKLKELMERIEDEICDAQIFAPYTKVISENYIRKFINDIFGEKVV